MFSSRALIGYSTSKVLFVGKKTRRPPVQSLRAKIVIVGNSKACFKRRATAVPNSIDRIKFDFSTAVARRLKPIRATDV